MSEDNLIRTLMTEAHAACVAMDRHGEVELAFYDNRSTGQHGWGARQVESATDVITGWHASDPVGALRDFVANLRRVADEERRRTGAALDRLAPLG